MKFFSQRKGLKRTKSIQIDSMDKELRNRLWFALDTYYWQELEPAYQLNQLLDRTRLDPSRHAPKLRKMHPKLVTRLWNDYFKESLDSEKTFEQILEKIHKYYFKCKWFEVYDFIEFIYRKDTNIPNSNKFRIKCNSILEEEASGYRLVGPNFVEITSETDISEIEEAMATPLISVNNHLKRALELMADRKSPDYRNSIKEAISAVEAICKSISKNNKATLPEALNEIERKKIVEIHPALKKGFSNIYGYTSSAEGIRHALTDEPNLYIEDARMMLVSCSAFINYLTTKSARAGINLA